MCIIFMKHTGNIFFFLFHKRNQPLCSVCVVESKAGGPHFWLRAGCWEFKGGCEPHQNSPHSTWTGRAWAGEIWGTAARPQEEKEAGVVIPKAGISQPASARGPSPAPHTCLWRVRAVQERLSPSRWLIRHPNS